MANENDVNSNTKYLVYEDNEGCEHSIMFPTQMGHDEMKALLKPKRILGAGFCEYVMIDDSLEIKCQGYSHSLNINSRPEDSLRVTLDYLGFNYKPQ